MDLSFTPEQVMLRQSLSRYLADHYGFDAWRKFTATPDGRDPRHWAQFAELGLLAASLPEAQGGLGGSAVDVMVIAEEFGKALVVEPFVPTVVIGGGALMRSSDALQAEWLPKIAAGETIMAFAFAEAQGRYNLADLTMTARKTGDDWTLDGRKAVVLGAPWADMLLVTARTSGSQREEKGVGLFLVAKTAPGITSRDFRTLDGQRASEIGFQNVGGAHLLGSDDDLAMVSSLVDAAIAAHAAEAVGAMHVLLDATVGYAKTRQQFGVPIGKFQVLQHRMVDMHIAHQQAQSASLMATLRLDAPRTVSAAKAVIGKQGRFIAESAVQTHGGIGMTDELNVGHYFKRLTALEILYGSPDHHLRRMAALEGQS